MTNRIHEGNGQTPHRPGPLETAAIGERRLIEQLHATAERLDRLATDELTLAKERLADSAARLAGRVGEARQFVEATLTRAGNLLAGLADLFSDDVTRADELIPAPAQSRPLTAGEQEAIAQAPAHHGPPDDEDDPNDDIDDGEEGEADPYADVANVGQNIAQELSRAKHVHELDPYSNGAAEPSEGEWHEAAKQVADALAAHDTQPKATSPRKKGRGRGGRKS